MNQPKLCKAIEYVVDRYGPVDGRTRLLKLVYLADKQWAARHGKPFTEAHYYWWNHGPFAREILAALEWMDGVEVVQRQQATTAGTLFQYVAGDRTRLGQVHLDPKFIGILDEVAATWNREPLQKLLDHVYADPAFTKTKFGDALFPGTPSLLAGVDGLVALEARPLQVSGE